MPPNLTGKEDKYETIFFYALAITLVSLAFSIRFLNSISIALLPLAILIHPRRKQLMSAAFRHPVFISFFIFFLFQLSGWFYTGDEKQHLREMEIRTGMLVYPFFFLRGVKTGFPDTPQADAAVQFIPRHCEYSLPRLCFMAVLPAIRCFRFFLS